jgi:hypothetical protein
VIEGYGSLVVGNKGELMVELENRKIAEDLSEALLERFGDQVLIAP